MSVLRRLRQELANRGVQMREGQDNFKAIPGQQQLALQDGNKAQL